MKRVSTAIFGKGTIGSEVYRRAVSKEWDVKWITDSKRIYSDISEGDVIDDLKNYEKHLKGIDVLFLAIPSNVGNTAYDYIRRVAEKEIPVVTCEKGALSSYYPELEDLIKTQKLRYNASVGGGSRFLTYLQERCSSKTNEIHAVLNGTLNYIFEELSRGRDIERVVEESKRRGYAEPGAKNVLEVFNTETVRDVPMKTSILFNTCNLDSRKMRWNDIQTKKMDSGTLEEVLKNPSEKRYIVSLSKRKRKEESLGGFKHQIGEWHISAGFKNIEENPMFEELLLPGINNAVITSEGYFGRDGTYLLTGPGAGAEPTASAMMIDAENVLNLKKIEIPTPRVLRTI